MTAAWGLRNERIPSVFLQARAHCILFLRKLEHDKNSVHKIASHLLQGAMGVNVSCTLSLRTFLGRQGTFWPFNTYNPETEMIEDNRGA